MSLDEFAKLESAPGNDPAPALANPSVSGNGAVDMTMLDSFEDLQLDDGSDLIVELIDLYLVELPKRVKEIHDASIESEWVLLKGSAHALKGSSSNLGVRYVTEICEKLGRMDDHDSPATAATLVRLLEYESAMASASLGAVRQRRLT